MDDFVSCVSVVCVLAPGNFFLLVGAFVGSQKGKKKKKGIDVMT
jgi:hypothetical protein